MIKNLINLLFPRLCSGCNSILLQNEGAICIKCRHEIPITNHHLIPENETLKKFYGRLPLEYASSFFYYHKEGIVQQLIHHLKYKGRQEIGELLGNWYFSEIKDLTILKTVTEIIPVPLHKKRLQERGYNQLTTFGKALAAGFEIPYNETILLRKYYSKTQTKKTIFSRTEIGTELFEVHFTEKDHGKHFLLIDDVITSGATLEACGKMLLKIPNASLSILAIGYTHS
ncbi:MULTISPECIES: ComF family protein [Flavobacterium]|uniref:ComF family protein n=1 Tax=Flavobacterium TaxID=237 RepID=UPI0015B15B2E|nr:MULTISPECIES: phosphoribosyltransferase family protein [Flavobacterium]